MIKVILDDGSLSVVDWFQIIGAIATALATIAALITTIQNRQASKQIQHERHMMVKPSFRIRAVSEDRKERVIEINVVNLGFNRTQNLVTGDWVGSQGVKVSVVDLFKTESNKDGDDLKVVLDFSNSPTNDIQGDLSLLYADILGKTYKESIKITIWNHHDEDFGDNPILENEIVSKYFS